jgi:hypothetical protein
VTTQLYESDRLSSPAVVRLRGALGAFAVILAIEAIWIVAAEAMRPPVPRFFTDLQSVAAAVSARNRAAAAAHIGGVRGDLWAESALTYVDLVARSGADKMPNALSHAQDVARRALTLAPHDARVWLILAGLELRRGSNQAAAALKMSYFTGPSEIELIPLRLRIAVTSGALTDDDIRLMVRRDIRLIATRYPELKPALLAAYADALPTAKPVLDEAVKELDPALLSAMQSGSQAR